METNEKNETIEKKLVVKQDDAELYNRLMNQDTVDLEKEKLEHNDTFCIASVKFDDGIEAELNICTEDTAVWAELWWRDEHGEPVDYSQPFNLLEGWFDYRGHAVRLWTEDANAWATR